MTKRAPLAAFLSSDRRPPCRSMMHLAIASPRPAPTPEALGPRRTGLSWAAAYIVSSTFRISRITSSG